MAAEAEAERRRARHVESRARANAEVRGLEEALGRAQGRPSRRDILFGFGVEEEQVASATQDLEEQLAKAERQVLPECGLIYVSREQRIRDFWEQILSGV